MQRLKPYLNDPLFELQKVMPELRGLKADEEDLPALLPRIRQKTEDLSVQMPDLISREEVVQDCLRFEIGQSNQSTIELPDFCSQDHNRGSHERVQNRPPE